MRLLIELGVRLLDIIFAVGLIGSVLVLIMTGFEDMLTILGKSDDEPSRRQSTKQRAHVRASHQSSATPANIL